MKKFKEILIISFSTVIVAGGALALLLQPLFAFGQLPTYTSNSRLEWKEPVYNAAKKTVFIIADNKVTEMFDMLAPYYLFQNTGRLNVYIVAREKVPIAIKKNVFILPQLTFREADSLKLTADVIVIPALSIRDKKQDPAVISFIKTHFTPMTKLMAVCDGAATAAATGLFDGRPITCHASDLAGLKTLFNKPVWIKDVNVAHSGNLYSTAGVSNAVEGSLMVINGLFGSQTMQAVATAIHYSHVALTNTHQSKSLKFGDMLTIAGKVVTRKSRRLGLVLQDGVSELDMVSVLDTYGRSFPKSIQCITPADSIIHTRYGVTVICTGDKTAAKLDELHVLLPCNEGFINSRYPNIPVIHYADGQYLIDACLARIKQQYGQKFQTVVKLMLDYN